MREMPVKRADQIPGESDSRMWRMLCATPGKGASVWADFAAEFLRHNGHPKAIQHVAIDMSAAYTKGVSDNLGSAKGGVRQVPRHPECGGGVRPGSEDAESGRRLETGPAGADAVDVAQEPGELD
jgi:hypothetical protein